MNTIRDRLERLRGALRREGLTHYFVPSADEHLDEYLPPWRQRREWLTGFTGSAGDLLLGLTDAETWLFADGRYHLQAEQQLAGTGIQVMKVGTEAAKTPSQLLKELAAERGAALVVGHDPMVLSVAGAEALAAAVNKGGGRWTAIDRNLVDEAWTDRPAPPESRLVACPLAWTGASVDDKVARMRAELKALGAEALVAVRLDQIAWLLNLRSLDDIPYNPVFESFLWIDGAGVHLFVRAPERRLPEDYSAGVAGFTAHEYAEFATFLRARAGIRIALDPERTTAGVLQLLEGAGATLVRADSPIELAKAVKNAAELAGMERANLLASVAKTRALLWLERERRRRQPVTEQSFRAKIEDLYAALDGYRGLSFNTIAAAGEHGAIVHYGAADATPLRDGELFIIDSGIQMDAGTTDDTRTAIVGTPTGEQRRLYTLVLKAHIRGARQKFPAGTPGNAIDAITRAPLWSDLLNYDHGTGHGVGAFLNVHEGPFSISESSRRAASAVALKPGMITSIEPGYYRAGFGGIRLENLYRVAEEPRAVDGRKWLGFVPLTFVPFESALIDADLLDAGDRAWLAAYHAECVERLAPHLAEEERAQLAARCR